MARGYSERGKSFSFELQGVKELDRMLHDLPRAMGKTVLRNALKKAAQPVEDAAILGVPRDTGNLQEHINISTTIKRSQGASRTPGQVDVYVGSSSPHAHLVEFGTGPRYTTGGGFKGQMPANPFLRKAFEATKERALKILIDELREQLMKAVRRLRKKAESGTLGKRAVKDLLG